MYWPVATPRIYATSSSRQVTITVHAVSHDGLDLPSPSASSQRLSPGHGSFSPALGSTGPSGHDALGLPVEPMTPATPMTPAIQSVEHAFHHDGHDGLSPRPAPPLSVLGKEPILALQLSRSGHLFATITATSMTIWQTKPTVVLAVVVRSNVSLASYGDNVDLLLRPDSAIIVVYTSRGFLITYSLATDAVSQVYKPQFSSHTNVQRRRQSHVGDPGHARPDQILWGPGEGGGVHDISVRFRMVIKVDAGIESALALDDELVVATTKPAAVQCIRWTPDNTGSQTSTELLSRMGWLDKKVTVCEMTHDKPMSLSTWVTSDGKAYAVQRNTGSPSGSRPESSPASSSASISSTSSQKKLFRGYCFHTPQTAQENARRAAINARFSLVAVGCVDGHVRVYSARDYVGNIPPSHTHQPPVSASTTGRLTKLTYSPDGHCLFAGYENGWATWSVYGKLLGHSFQAERDLARANGEEWLVGVQDAAWVGGSGEMLLLGRQHEAVWLLEMARSAAAGCYGPANVFRTVLLTNQNIMVYRGYDQPDMTAISAAPSLWHTARIPSTYLLQQWPIRQAVVSADGRYVAVAGRRGLAHYSVASGRWRAFASDAGENEFQVRGGMCWYQNVLVVAVEASRGVYELRLYARESALDSGAFHVEPMPAAVVLVTPSGEDSLLVYTHDNLLHHFIFASGGGGGSTSGIRLVQVGQIGFHGIVRSPARVRGLSWVLPDSQLLDGDPSQDVAVASVLVLVDGKLVLFRPSINDEGQLKYDMRILAQSVEYYVCMKDQPSMEDGAGAGAGDEDAAFMRKSLWLCDGGELKVWPDTQVVLDAVVSGGEIPPPVTIAVDFYPLSVLLSKGLVLGVEPDLVQRRDVGFSYFRFAIRTNLFLPDVLRSYLAGNRGSAALQLARRYQHLVYFAHALEILLHQVLDEEVDAAPPPAPDAAVLPRVLSLLSSFRAYLDIVVQCTRKTEVRSWRTLFAYLPPPQELFEESLLRGSLKTAGGYLLVLHTFDELATASEQGIRLLRRAMREGDWELCRELARFLAAMDDSGQTLREALAQARQADGEERGSGSAAGGDYNDGGPTMQLAIPHRNGGHASPSESDVQSASDDGNSSGSSIISISPGAADSR
ncbi:duf1339 domain containing protein [Grosmannia clavigera kw1407]|uniref:Duf1339 domain containing protein n=1 Tax=Grosmannia clavigera (strain kw1407 / UAMH 11150) TaxID=655863 RepID=F0XC83_GROCL|nr:duf1339 domain containing protein [Grosmannia clavigera kw1407]EFX04522.1 duf1339 domain containing protein [Grosmannia clavigera kw1407]